MKPIVQTLARELGIKPSQVEKTIELIDEGNTIPFIARYRKEIHGGLDDEVLRNLDERLKYLRHIEERKVEVLRLIEEQGKLTENLRDEITKATVLQRVEDLYRPFRQKKSTRGSKARERGLEPLAMTLLSGEFQGDLNHYGASFIDPDRGVASVEEALQGAKDIVAEMVSVDPDHRRAVKNRILKTGQLVSEGLLEEKTVYEMYYDFKESLLKPANHRILAMNRGEKEKILKIRVDYDLKPILEYLAGAYTTKKNPVTDPLLQEAIEDGFKRLMGPSIEREIRSDLREVAEEDAIRVFAKNFKPLLLIPPIKGARVLGIDPSFRTGCKLAVLDEYGTFLFQETIYPHEPQNQVEASSQRVREIIETYQIDLIAIGNGTASRETESFIAAILPGIRREVAYAIVSEAGASVYSASKLATEEFPEVNVSIRGAISIGRRLQDPLAELVKIDPKSVGVGQYQHDVNQKRLEETLSKVVEDCVNSVGVEVSSASASLLGYVAGISPQVARAMVRYRETQGPLVSRKDLKKVKGLGEKAFEQAAGFIRIADSDNPLDATAVHPESYPVALELLGALGYSLDDLRRGALADIGDRTEGRIEALASSLGVGTLTLRDIVEELKKPGRDPREELPPPILRKDVVGFDDLHEGMILMGTVRNVVNFGAFVDIGLKNDGLVHISQLADRFVKDPMEVVEVGNVVKVKIIGLDKERQKISLTMKGFN
ncbi:MAG: RNA-binding transcriptional accessory protein [delta proteobacterium ML8_F1]|nr:MAG: RNA-binding transcriptional accessory protein [delta proteobacterium ML8_F1]